MVRPATTFEVRGGAALRRRLETVSERLHADSWAEGVHVFLLARMRLRFDTQGRSEGTPWPELLRQEPKWAALKARVGADPRPLRWRPGIRERLYPSLTDPRDADHRFEVRGDEIVMASGLDYAGRIDRGGEVNPLGEPTPPRPLAKLGRTTREVMSRLLKRHATSELPVPLRSWEVEDV